MLYSEPLGCNGLKAVAGGWVGGGGYQVPFLAFLYLILGLVKKKSRLCIEKPGSINTPIIAPVGDNNLL